MNVCAQRPPNDMISGGSAHWLVRTRQQACSRLQPYTSVRVCAVAFISAHGPSCERMCSSETALDF